MRTEFRRSESLGDPLIPDQPAGIVGVAYTADASTLTAVSSDQLVWLWNLTDPAHPQSLGEPLNGRKGLIGWAAVAFASDGRVLATSFNDQTVRLWNVKNVIDIGVHTREHACALTRRGFNPDEWATFVPNLRYHDSCAI